MKSSISRASGKSPAQLKKIRRDWAKNFPNVSERRAWQELFTKPQDAAYWKYSGITIEEARRAVANKWTREQALSKRARDQRVAVGQEKAPLTDVTGSGYSADDHVPTEWVTVGVETHEELDEWLQTRLPPMLVKQWKALGLSASQTLRARGQGKTLEDMRRELLRRDRLQESAAVDECSSEARSGEEATDSGPSSGNPAAGDSEQVVEALKGLGIGWSRSRSFAGCFVARGRRPGAFDAAGLSWRGRPASLAWLSEILAHAHTAKPHLQRDPAWPMIFSGDVTIDLEVDGSTAVAWVGIEDTGVFVGFNTVKLTTFGDLNDVDTRFALGVAISWFVDCTISLRVAAHPHFVRRDPPDIEASTGSRVQESRLTFTPSQAFRNEVAGIRWGRLSPPRAHRVAGHVRNLPWDHTPSDEAREQAPPHIRVLLEPGQTFVRAHSRGGENLTPAVHRRLRKHSLLADSLGLVGRL